MLDLADREGTDLTIPAAKTVTLTMLVKGKRPLSHLVATLSDIAGVHEVGQVSDDAGLD